jgi:hypothetical protein
VRLLHSLDFSDILLADLSQGSLGFKLHGNSLVKLFLAILLNSVRLVGSLRGNGLVLSDVGGYLFSDSSFLLDNSGLGNDLFGCLLEEGLLGLEFSLHD